MSTLAELQAELAEIKTAISAILTGGQEYKFNDMQVEQSVKKGDLSTLRQMKKDLEWEIYSLSRSGGFYGS